ncbi:MAG: hypothetical protein GY851_25340, partial [bacterium]|nr:hypothetical protein [bacterium]
MMSSYDVNPWQLAQEQLQRVLDDHSYKNWFSQTRFQSYEDGCLTVGVPSQFFADWLRDHYLEAIKQCVGEYLPDLREVRFRPEQDLGLPATPVKGQRDGGSHAERGRATKANRASERAFDTPPPQRRSVSPRHDQFNPRYVFDRFVVGGGNRFAHAAAKAVAESPARAYNPLFLYGGTGLGKTHLMQAIGQEILKRQPDANVVFISSEHFT